MNASLKARIVCSLLSLLILAPILAVNAEVVPQEWQNTIEAYLRQVDVNTTAEIVIYLVQSLSGHGITKEGSEINEIVKLGVYIFNELPLDTPNGPVVGIGKSGKDNGVLVLVAMEEQEWRIEVGYGLEGDITDIESNWIAQAHLIPKFQEEKYGEGLYDTVAALAQKIPAAQDGGLPIRERYFYENTATAEQEIPWWVTILIIAIFGVIGVVIIIIAYLVKTGRVKADRSGRSYQGGDRSGGGGRTPSGPKGGGGRSGGGGSKGKW